MGSSFSFEMELGGRLVLTPEDLAEDAHPCHGLAVRHRFSMWRGELLCELANKRLGGVGGEAAGVAGGLEDVEEELGEALAVFGGGECLVDDWDADRIFEAGAGEFVEADGNGLAEVHGEMTRIAR